MMYNNAQINKRQNIYQHNGDNMETTRQNNYLKYIVLTHMADNKERCVFDVADYAEGVTHWKNVGIALMKYALEYTHPLLTRRRIGARFYYKITDVGHERLKQMKAAHRFFGVYRLTRGGTQLLVKTKTGNYAVNPEILPYAPEFCDVPMDKLQMYVGLL